MDNDQPPKNSDIKELNDNTQKVVVPTWKSDPKLPTPAHNGGPAREDEPDKTGRGNQDKSSSRGKMLGSLISKTRQGKILVQGAELIYDQWKGTDTATTETAPKPYYQQRDEWLESQVDLINRYGPKFVFGEHDRGMDRGSARKQLEKSVERDIHYQISYWGNGPGFSHSWQRRLDAAEKTHQQVVNHSYVAKSATEKLQYLVHQHRLNINDDMKLNRVYEPESALYASKQAVQNMHKAGYSQDEIKDALSDVDPQMAGWSTKGYLTTRGIAKTYLKEAMADLENRDRRFYLDKERDLIAAWRVEQNIAPSDRRTPREYDDAIKDRLNSAKKLYERLTPQTQVDRDLEHKAEFMRLMGHEYSTHGDKIRSWDADPQHPQQMKSVTQRVACRMYVAGFDRKEIYEAVRAFDIKTEGWSEDSVNHYLQNQIDPVLDFVEPDRQQLTLWKQQHGISQVRRLDVIEKVHQQLEGKELANTCERSSREEMSLDNDLFE